MHLKRQVAARSKLGGIDPVAVVLLLESVPPLLDYHKEGDDNDIDHHGPHREEIESPAGEEAVQGHLPEQEEGQEEHREREVAEHHIERNLVDTEGLQHEVGVEYQGFQHIMDIEHQHSREGDEQDASQRAPLYPLAQEEYAVNQHGNQDIVEQQIAQRREGGIV